jgi:enediyne biosynthesis protein E4
MFKYKKPANCKLRCSLKFFNSVKYLFTVHGKWFRLFFFLSLVVCFFTSCNNKKTLFTRLPSSFTGVTFNNRIIENDSLNVIDFEYLYNGAGVGVGDFNNDGLQDIFFAANQSGCKIYINQGNFKFKDVTGESGLKTPYWNTGVSIIDINQDGLLDIYLCTANTGLYGQSPNQLFLNMGLDKDGSPHFKEIAKQVGLADEGFSTQAAFFDYDNDGDLDCYILTNALENYNRSLPAGQKKDGTGKSTDRLYRNDGLSPSGLPLFTNVSKEAGITIEGWGLGIGIADFN